MIYSFADCELDTDVHELRRNGTVCAVEPQVFDVLRLLLENRDRLVAREELFETIWQGRLVSDATLSSRIKAARQAVGDSGKRQAIIQTLPRRGFRFVAAVQEGLARPMAAASGQEIGEMETPAPELPDRPSIAVLPFVSLSDDAEQQYLADGMAEDIITGLSKFAWLFVIARNSTFIYKDQAVDVRDVARDLGVRYVLEGSIRHAGNQIRVSGQLIDASTGSHLWAERYDRSLDDIFTVQDEVTAAIVAAIAPEIGQAEIARAKRKPPDNLDAWGLYQRALAFYPSGEREEWLLAIELLDQAVAADPAFIDALVMAGHMRTRYAHFFNPDDYEELLQQAEELIQRGMRIDPRHSMGHAALGRLTGIQGQYEQAVAFGRDAVLLNPNSFLASLEYGITLMLSERFEEAIAQFKAAQRLNPKDPHATGVFAAHATALFALGRYEESVEMAKKSMQSANPRHWSQAVLIAALHKLGRKQDVTAEMRLLFSKYPDFTMSVFPRGAPTKYFAPVLRELGIPE